MTLPLVYDLDVYRGDTWQQAFRLVNSGVDFTGGTPSSQARNGSVTYQLVADWDPLDPGAVVISLPPESLPPGTYAYDVEVTTADGLVTATWVRGHLTVARDVTNELPLIPTPAPVP